MSLSRNWSEKVKQNETHDDPALSVSKEHEEEPAERNYIFTNAFLCSVVLILFSPLQNNSFSGGACNVLNLSFSLFCVLKKTQQKMKLLFSA